MTVVMLVSTIASEKQMTSHTSWYARASHPMMESKSNVRTSFDTSLPTYLNDLKWIISNINWYARTSHPMMNQRAM